ncbi:template-activating factor I [Nematocida major]|uniref:template-activating factor I n=1 Tax=Nematocida major TaxID=1912982 RepID=UPI0020089A7A|nr:template-activating factor I [Nematocida major]KAH9385923.1 template-activating factor I [Nematocida major]
MSPENTLKKLVDIQTAIDTANIETLKKEHQLKVSYFNDLKPTLQERDALLAEIDGFWDTVLISSECIDVLAEMENPEPAAVDISWIGGIRVEYREDFKYYIRMDVKENPYFENSVLEKEFSLFEDVPGTSTPIQWKGKKNLENPVMRFFMSTEASDEDLNMSMLQIFSDVYFNAVYYYVRADESEEEEE